jgi:hypothetical protein
MVLRFGLAYLLLVPFSTNQLGLLLLLLLLCRLTHC